MTFMHSSRPSRAPENAETTDRRNAAHHDWKSATPFVGCTRRRVGTRNITARSRYAHDTTPRQTTAAKGGSLEPSYHRVLDQKYLLTILVIFILLQIELILVVRGYYL